MAVDHKIWCPVNEGGECACHTVPSPFGHSHSPLGYSVSGLGFNHPSTGAFPTSIEVRLSERDAARLHKMNLLHPEHYMLATGSHTATCTRAVLDGLADLLDGYDERLRRLEALLNP